MDVDENTLNLEGKDFYLPINLKESEMAANIKLQYLDKIESITVENEKLKKKN
jgi:hypothetical protein